MSKRNDKVTNDCAVTVHVTEEEFECLQGKFKERTLSPFVREILGETIGDTCESLQQCNHRDFRFGRLDFADERGGDKRTKQISIYVSKCHASRLAAQAITEGFTPAYWVYLKMKDEGVFE